MDAGETYAVKDILVMQDGTYLAFIENHSRGENFEGVYRLGANDVWQRVVLK